MTSPWPAAPLSRSTVNATSPNGVSMRRPALATPGMKFIGGEPMNPATNMFAGVS